MPEIDKYIYSCHRNIVSSNHNKVLRVKHAVNTLMSDNITLEN